jgi:phosphoribosylanthranilate isomerase
MSETDPVEMTQYSEAEIRAIVEETASRSTYVLAHAYGADAIGFIFWRPSARYIEPVRAGSIASALPALVTAVCVFVDPTPDEVEEALNACRGHCAPRRGILISVYLRAPIRLPG